jgi:ATP-dependent DNA ligase
MEARVADELPRDEGWQFEPKWDGFRCLAFRKGKTVDLRAKSGKPLGRYFPEMVKAVQNISDDRFVLDGELVIVREQSLSFDALQLRLHPAESRIRKLSVQTPALLILFDLLQWRGDLTKLPLSERRARLERFFKPLKGNPSFRLSPFTRKRSEAAKWLGRAGRGSLDGVIAKRVDGAYICGERDMLKIKCRRTADCVVGGFRYATKEKLVGSLLLGLYDDEGRLNHVGFTSSISQADRPALTKKLERLCGGAGFTGNAPGGPSRWSTERSSEWEPLKPKLVVEVQYDHVTDGRFRHGTKFIRWRPDKVPRQCNYDQLKREGSPHVILKNIVAR